MSLRIREALSMEYLEEFQLVAGSGGLDRHIQTVGILDYEIIEDTMDVFVEGELIITTLSVARHDPDLILKAVKTLVDLQAAALAVKAVYYDTLPQAALEYADKHDFPIFVFHPSIYIENVINTAFHGIKSRGAHERMEAKLEALFSGIMHPHTIHEIALELNPSFYERHIAVYCQEIRYASEDNTLRLLAKYGRMTRQNPRQSLFKFRQGLMAVFSYDSDQSIQLDHDINYLLDTMGIDRERYVFGISDEHASQSQLDLAIKESYYAFQTAQVQKTGEVRFHDSGIYQLLIPLKDNPWAEQFADRLITPILTYDEKYGSNLYETLRLYFALGCQTQAVADALFQHKNTILYRVRKVKELIGPFASECDFLEQLSTAIKIYEIRKEEGNL